MPACFRLAFFLGGGGGSFVRKDNLQLSGTWQNIVYSSISHVEQRHLFCTSLWARQENSQKHDWNDFISSYSQMYFLCVIWACLIEHKACLILLSEWHLNRWIWPSGIRCQKVKFIYRIFGQMISDDWFQMTDWCLSYCCISRQKLLWTANMPPPTKKNPHQTCSLSHMYVVAHLIKRITTALLDVWLTASRRGHADSRCCTACPLWLMTFLPN